MPKALEGKQQAVADEMDALVRTLMRYAGSPLDAWWAKFEDAIGDKCQTRAWPTQGEIAEVGAALSPRMSSQQSTGGAVDMDRSDGIWAERIRSGLACAGHFLWGRDGVRLLRKGLVTEEELRPWRSRAYFARKDLYGKEAADEWEREAKAAWASILAEPVSGQQTRRQIPDLREMVE